MLDPMVCCLMAGSTQPVPRFPVRVRSPLSGSRRGARKLMTAPPLDADAVSLLGRPVAILVYCLLIAVPFRLSLGGANFGPSYPGPPPLYQELGMYRRPVVVET